MKAFFASKGKQGLSNLGATCYINTAIQCLSHCIEFLHFILSKKTNDTLIDKLRLVLIEIWLNKRVCSPDNLVASINRNLAIDAYEQNDISEFIIYFIEHLNKEVSVKYKPSKQDLIRTHKYMKTSYDIQRLRMDISWFDKIGDEYSKLVDMFHGQSISQITCGNCNHISHNYEIYTNIMVPLNESTNSLENCLDLYFRDEVLNETIEWRCDECKEKVQSLKCLKLWRNPNIVIISLKRFTYDMRKNNKAISIPEYLSLDKYTVSKNNYKYRLISVACHVGSFHGGHYYALCRHPDDNWYLIDDDLVKQVEYESLASHGYVFFYEIM